MWENTFHYDYAVVESNCVEYESPPSDLRVPLVRATTGCTSLKPTISKTIITRVKHNKIMSTLA